VTYQFQYGIGWYIHETNALYCPYCNPTTAYSVASNIATIPYSAGENTVITLKDEPTLLSAARLTLILSAGSNTWSGASGAKEIFYQDLGLILYYEVSGAGWILRAEDGSGTLIGKTTTVWAWTTGAPAVSYRREPTRLRVWMNNVKELDVSGISSTEWNNKSNTKIGSSSVHAGKNEFLGRILSVSDDAADNYLDYTGFVSAKKAGNAAGQYSDFTGVQPGGTNTWDDIDDWFTGAADGDTTFTYDAGAANTTYRIYTLTADFSLANALGACIYSLARGGIAAKNTSGYHGFGDGTNIVESTAFATYPDAVTYLPLATVHPLAPGGGAWSAFNFNTLEVGFKHVVGTATDTATLTTRAAELFACTFLSDPTPSTDRRRALAGVV